MDNLLKVRCIEDNQKDVQFILDECFGRRREKIISIFNRDKRPLSKIVENEAKCLESIHFIVNYMENSSLEEEKKIMFWKNLLSVRHNHKNQIYYLIINLISYAFCVEANKCIKSIFDSIQEIDELKRFIIIQLIDDHISINGLEVEKGKSVTNDKLREFRIKELFENHMDGLKGEIWNDERRKVFMEMEKFFGNE
ncbi:hypothetical protein SNEBB_004247 [Seison nebaliae]|nr:hypothetical protein SNEBB_004247 [Seison nebaliae]